MMLIMNMVEFCQNRRSIDQKSIEKLSILTFLSDCGKSQHTGVFDDADHEYGGILPELLID